MGALMCIFVGPEPSRPISSNLDKLLHKDVTASSVKKKHPSKFFTIVTSLI